MPAFEDHVHIQRIRTALWQQRPYGRASVMIGAGFSLNASPSSPAVPPFPTWKQLGRMMVDRLYPDGSSPSHTKAGALQQALSMSGVLRLAEEYEAAFGRDALEAMLLSALPDESYEPGPLHQLLMKLPWADVLTTNYDTLLERAAARIHERRYDVVRACADIPSAMRPRIVKLHGSFPSNRPFIFTEEDFRTYPRRFGPFVNLAQQVVMETVLCLLGFSGDDPNFLHWTGWVRDNLGPAAPQIYLCGLLNLNTARRNLLHDRNVVPIDLSPAFPEDAWPNAAERHARALQWFLLNLEAGEPPLELSWPLSMQPPLTPKPADLPDLLPTNHDAPVSEPLNSDDKLARAEQIQRTTQIWRGNRLLYPGWLVAPESSRDSLWTHTMFWAQEVHAPDFSTLPLERRLQFLFEMNWRLERCLIPLFSNWMQMVDALLEAINPLPRSVQLPDATLVMGRDKPDHLDWAAVREAWVGLGFARLRVAREDQDQVAFDRWLPRLQSIVAEARGLNAQLQYQRVLLALGQADHSTVLSIFREWEPSDEDPFWLVRRASILAEIGELDDAHVLADQALHQIRARLRPGAIDIPMLSREGYALRLISGLSFARDFGAHSRRQEFHGRYEQLAQIKCDPVRDWTLLEAELRQPVPRPVPEVSETFNPDGTISQTYHMGSSMDDDMFLGYIAIRFAEDAAIPARCGYVEMGGKVLARACEWIRAQSPNQAASNLLRVGDAKAIGGHFTPQRVALLSTDSAAKLRQLAARCLDHGLKNHSLRVEPSNPQVQVAFALLAVLARRTDAGEQRDEMERMLRLYGHEGLRSSHVLSDSFKDYVEVICSLAGSRAVADNAVALLGLPIPGEGAFQCALARTWPEPFAYLRTNLPKNCRETGAHTWSALVERLFAAAASTESEMRSRAVLRLERLHDSGLLSDAEQARFAQALWSQLDSSKGLPAVANLYDFALLTLPQPTPKAAEQAFKAFYLGRPLPQIVNKIQGADGKAQKQVVGTDKAVELNAIVSATSPLEGETGSRFGVISWTPEEVKRIGDLAVEWWRDEDRSWLAEHGKPLLKNAMDQRLQSCLRVLRKVVIPRLSPGDPEVATIRGFIEGVSSIDGYSVVSPAILIVCPDMQEFVTRRIRQGLVSRDRSVARSAIHAIYEWLRHAKRGAIQSVPSDLLHELGHILGGRRSPAIIHALPYASDILCEFPDAVDDTFITSAMVGLEYLLSETEYRPDPPDAPSHVPYELVPTVRAQAAGLAAVLSKACGKDEQVIVRWHAASLGDPLQSVHRVAADFVQTPGLHEKAASAAEQV